MKKVMMFGFVSLIMLFFVNVNLVFAHVNASMLEETEKLIKSGVSCDELSDEQLELIGEYYMEMIHPGQTHEVMDQMMCGSDEGCEEIMHINMARMMYCGEYAGMGMMGMFQNGRAVSSSTEMHGMMSSTINYWNAVNVLYILLLTGLVVLVYLGILKLLKNTNKGRGSEVVERI